MCFFHVYVFPLHCEKSFIHWGLRIVGDNNGCSSGISHPSSFALPHHLPRGSDNAYLSGCPLSKNSTAVHFTPLLIFFRCFSQKKKVKDFHLFGIHSWRWSGGSFVVALSYGWLGGGRLCVMFNEVKVLSQCGFVCVCYQQDLAGILCV